jgi:hypothetical protein
VDQSEPFYDVVWPLGRQENASTALPPRVDGLDGKVIAELWDWMYEGDRVFAILEELLKEQYPSVQFVNYEVFGDIHGGDEHEIVQKLPVLLREHQVDAVIAGVGS